MIRLDAPESTPLSFGIVKQILHRLDVGPDADHPSLLKSFRILFPLDADLAVRVRSGSASLTDSATSQEQIRFFQQRRAIRSYITLARAVSERRGPVEVEIGRNAIIDASSRAFLQVASDIAGWEVRYRESSFDRACEGPWTAEERRLLALLETDVLAHHLDDVCSAAFEYINVGDAATGVALGRLLARHEQSPRVWNLLALGSAMQSRTEEAEFFYERWAESGGPLDRVRALYGRAMLAARHHQGGLRNIGRAGRLLDEAYALITHLDDDKRGEDMTVFEEVFNRNGAALILFREGDVDDALELLEWGIARLTRTTEKVAIHRSVLMYNLAQCKRQLGDGPGAIRAYEQLLEVDPHMPEYYLEAAKCYADENRLAEAEQSVRCALGIDDTLDTGWSLLGLYLERLKRYADAADAFAEASRLQPQHAAHLLNQAYSLILSGDPAAARARLVTLEPSTVREVERHASLLAETHLRQGDDDTGAAILEAALQRHPDSATLEANYKRVRNRCGS